MSAAAVERLECVPVAIGWHLASLVTEDVVDEVWTAWNPDNGNRVREPRFRRAFASLLSEGVAMGLSLTRFRDLSRRLPDPDEGAANWVPLFENAVAGRDKCSVRLLFSPARYQTFIRTPAPSSQEGSFERGLSRMTETLFYELGLILPECAIRIDEAIPDNAFRIEWNDLVLPPRVAVFDNQLLVNASDTDVVKQLGVAAEPAVHPETGSACAVVGVDAADACRREKLTVWNSKEHVILIVKATLRSAAGAFVNRILIDTYLSHVGHIKPALAKAAAQTVDKDVLVQVVRELLKEQISVRDMPSLLHAMLSARTSITVDLAREIVFAHAASPPMLRAPNRRPGLIVADYVEYARAAWRRYISHKYTRGQNTLLVYLLDPEIESRLRQPRPLTEDEARAVASQIRREIPANDTARDVVILTTQECRRGLRQAIYGELPNLAVLSYQELSPDINIQPLARISADVRVYDEAFYGFFDAFSAEPEVEPPAVPTAAAGGGDFPMILQRVIDSRGEEIVDLVMQDIRKEHAHRFAEQSMRRFAGRVLRGYRDLAIASEVGTLEAICRQLSVIFARTDVNISAAVGMPFRIATAIRVVLAKESLLDANGAAEIAPAAAACQQLCTAASRAAAMVRDVGLRARYTRLFQ